jgi:membrane-anchored glycerophosphoryl diester phosphodiesterase (GDPDase)
LTTAYYNSTQKAKLTKSIPGGNKKLMKVFSSTVIIREKLPKTKEFFMITEANIYLSLGLAALLFFLSIRLAVSLYQAS